MIVKRASVGGIDKGGSDLSGGKLAGALGRYSDLYQHVFDDGCWRSASRPHVAYLVDRGAG
ncbi:hypothetical protein [Sinorhizobium meliloti]|uniref:hypothetical protein n=1 Tax=Rhizobium meliloti TaxID=382 RepID=UPI000FD43845|nr:hypothetical protein [Sinorhizobium meliloti]MDW9552610.1 hypothetical protein [Sinorhizobium meliloti]MDW9621998.1 hypothetical protein [Sinorhizobium meliloti]MDX0011437.1 hypothetical protein [Sinorhizobium meliloti]MDX0160183.1 hypothetical protein [Sinorhizobium meliloti]MDX0179247.1 hypothetical protein [Sinorhizobium meliloti]